MKETKIVLIGAGAVGCSFLYAAMNQGLATKYGIIDAFPETRDGNVLDLEDAIASLPRTYDVYASDYEDIKDADFIVITAGRPQKHGETRLEMLFDNAKIMKDIAQKVKASGFNGITIIVANPVDVMTTIYFDETGFPKNKVIGSGTILDTARLKREIGKRIGIAPKSVTAYVMGEHGDSSMIPYSSITIGGVPFSEFEKEAGLSKDNYATELEKPISRKAYEIINRKRATFYGIGAAITSIIRAIQEDSREILVVGANLDGEYGFKGVNIGVPAVISKNGIEKVITIKLTPEEKAKFDHSLNIVINKVKELKEYKG